MMMTMTPFLDHLQSPASTRPLGAFSLHDSSLPMRSAPVTASKPGPRATLTSTASCARFHRPSSLAKKTKGKIKHCCLPQTGSLPPRRDPEGHPRRSLLRYHTGQ